MNIPNRNNKVGLMLRTSLQSNASELMVAKVAHSGLQVLRRNNDGEDLYGNPNGFDLSIYSLYDWLRIERTGNEVIICCSKDAASWSIVAQQTLNLPSQVYVGMFVTGGTSTYPSMALFDNVSTSKTAPVASITSPANNSSYTAPANVTLTASASDADGTISSVAFAMEAYY